MFSQVTQEKVRVICNSLQILFVEIYFSLIKAVLQVSNKFKCFFRRDRIQKKKCVSFYPLREAAFEGVPGNLNEFKSVNCSALH